MLAACGVNTEVTPRVIGGAPFLCFEAQPLTGVQRAFLSHFSALYMTCALEGELLRPLEPVSAPPFPGDMPDILKYKGKTNSDFTQLMINLALAAGGQWKTENVHILDPICGRGTSLFCALTRGMDATGVDMDRKSIDEGILYAKKWLQYHRIKHTATKSSLTLPYGRGAPCTTLSCTGSDDKAHTLRMITADTRNAAALLSKRKAHALVADLPYGVQHAPLEKGGVGSLEGMLKEALPAWRQSLQSGCAAAIAFNSYTLKRETLKELVLQAGFVLMEDPMYANFSHWVEQAVQRDVLVAVNFQRKA